MLHSKVQDGNFSSQRYQLLPVWLAAADMLEMTMQVSSIHSVTGPFGRGNTR